MTELQWKVKKQVSLTVCSRDDRKLKKISGGLSGLAVSGTQQSWPIER